MLYESIQFKSPMECDESCELGPSCWCEARHIYNWEDATLMKLFTYFIVILSVKV